MPPSTIIDHEELDNRLISNRTKSNDEIDESAKPLAKLDLIKKFDQKYKAEIVGAAPVISSVPTPKKETICIKEAANIAAHIENDNGDQLSSTDYEYSTASNKLAQGNENGSNGCGQVPPKPLPRTSRNNSVSSDQGFVMIGDEITPRPVAKPRSTSISYKVYILFSKHPPLCFSHICVF